MTLRHAFCCVLGLATPAVADGPTLALPIACDLGETCYIQQFVDTDPGPAAIDFTCGPLSYDGHQGTDFALPSLAAMAQGVPVLAAAPGIVTGVRDGMTDARQGDPGAPDVSGRECGNGVVIDHADGWQTQYCHLAEGSVEVARGETVATGDVLGRVGLSGETQFPHVHLTVRHNGAIVDPFAPEAPQTCGAPQTGTLWQDPPAYVPGGLIQAGLATSVPEFDAIKAGPPPPVLAADAPLVLWGHVFGGREGDVMQITITGPQGEVIAHEEALTRTQAQLFRAAGRRAPSGGWPAGVYDGTVSLLRDGALIDSLQTTATLN